jgi:hypothetical protein
VRATTSHDEKALNNVSFRCQRAGDWAELTDRLGGGEHGANDYCNNDCPRDDSPQASEHHKLQQSKQEISHRRDD